MTALTFSIIVNTYNRLHTLPTTLNSLRQLRYPRFEIIVVHGPCTDGTQDWLATHATDCKIGSVAETNLSISRNAGLALASGDIVAYIDDDGLPEPNWLDELAAAFENDEVVASGGYVHDHTGYTYQARAILSDRWGVSDVNASHAGARPWRMGDHEFAGLMGVNTAFRRSALAAIGGFDEAYVYYLDETDVLVRLMDQGGQLAMRPLAEVHHKFAASHLRDTATAPRPGSYRIITTSENYYIIQANRGLKPLSELFDHIAVHEKLWIKRAEDHLKSQRITAEQFEELKLEIADGLRKGVELAFGHPNRLTRRPDSFADAPDFKPVALAKPSEARIRLAFVSPECPPDLCGGVAIFIYQLARELAERGHEITILTKAHGEQQTVDWQDGIWVHRVPPGKPCRRHPGLPATMPENLATLATNMHDELQRMLPIRQFDYVIGAIWDLDLGAIIASQLVPVGLYLVTTYQHVMQDKPDWQEGTPFHKAHVGPMIEAEKWALETCPDILTSTNAIADDVARLYGADFKDRLHRLPFGIEDKQTERARNPGDDTLRILYLGRLEPRKGIDLLLDAAPALCAENAKVELHVIGQDHGGYKDAFLFRHAGASWLDRVIFHGPVDHYALHQAYADCDIFVAPSRFESFGLIYLEAMRYDRACVGIAKGGVPEVVERDVTGLLIDEPDVKALQAAIQTLIDDPTLREQMGKAGRKRYEEIFSIAAYADRMETFLFKRLGIASVDAH